MIVTRRYARRLIAAGKARESCIVRHEGRLYVAFDRLDLQRVDHYPATVADSAIPEATEIARRDAEEAAEWDKMEAELDALDEAGRARFEATDEADFAAGRWP